MSRCQEERAGALKTSELPTGRQRLARSEGHGPQYFQCESGHSERPALLPVQTLGTPENGLPEVRTMTLKTPRRKCITQY